MKLLFQKAQQEQYKTVSVSCSSITGELAGIMYEYGIYPKQVRELCIQVGMEPWMSNMQPCRSETHSQRTGEEASGGEENGDGDGNTQLITGNTVLAQEWVDSKRDEIRAYILTEVAKQPVFQKVFEMMSEAEIDVGSCECGSILIIIFY